MAAISKVILLCIIFITFLTIVNSARLNVGRLLLPYNQGVPTNYTLEVTGGGCYKWSSSRQEVISITPVEENLDRICTTKVVLSAVSPYHDRHSVIVVATDEDTGLTLRCDVTVDVIHSISIVTTTREIFLEDAPVAFEVKAENDQGDTFSCLDGVSFQWIITDRFGKPSENNVLRFLKFADSAFKTPPAIDFWEQQGLHGSKVLLEGVKTGKLTLYYTSDLQSSEITLIVVANLVLNPPSDVYILPEMTIQYQVELIKQRKAHRPASLGLVFKVSPGNKWSLQEKTTYTVYIELYDSKHHQIYLSDNIKVEVTFSNLHFQVSYSSDNGTYYVVQTLAPGSCQIQGEIKGITKVSLYIIDVGFWEADAVTFVVVDEEFVVLAPIIYCLEDHVGEGLVLLSMRGGVAPVSDVAVVVVVQQRVVCRKQFLEDSLLQNIKVEVTFSNLHFQVSYSSDNGTYYVVQTLAPGSCQIQGEIKGITKNGKLLRILSPVSGYQEVTIYQAVRVSPSVVLLPWNDHIQPKYFVVLKATGGTGSYKWLSSNNSIAKITHEEHLDRIQIVTHTIGNASITAVDLQNSLFIDSAKNGKLLRILSPVSGYQEVTIYQAVRVSPSVVLLPWNDHIQPKYFVVLKATGGTGSYKWLSSNNSIAKITHEEHLDRIQIVTHTIGNASITAVDLQNSLFIDSAKISIQIVASIKFLNATVETEIGQSVILPLAIYGYESEGRIKMFNNCSEIPIEVDVNLEKFSYSEGTDIVSTGCRALQFTCKAIGYSDVVVHYDTGEGIINATSTIACHKLLQPIYPKQFAVLALGSSMEVAFEGGPRPWPLDLQGHYIHMRTSSSKITEITLFDSQHYHKDVHVARVTCKSIGESMLDVTVGNHLSLKNPLPVENKASVRIICAVPKSIQLIPKRKEPKGKKYPCQLLETDEKLPVHCYQDLEIELWVKDSLGRKFSNISSLNVHWELSDENLGKLENKMNVITEVTSVGGFRKAIRSIQKLHPFEKEGLLIVKVEVVGYKHDILYRENINVQWNVISTIQQSVILELVNDADIIPDKLSIFNHPSIKNYLNIVQGSGQFYIDMSNNKKAKVQYVKATRKIEIAPLEDGSFTLTVHDMCLEARKTIAAQIQISGISAIRIHMVDKVELGKSFTATLEILDEEGHRLPTSLFPLINLKPILTSNIIAVKSEAVKDDNQYQAFYVITGLSLGHTSVIFTAATDAESSTKTISSESFPIQVFPPLRIEPKNLTLIVGATFQVICSGGPLPQSNVEYSILEQNIASVNTAGIITASKLGKTTLTAKAVGHDRKTGHSVVYSQDQVVINVILLKGIKIKAPLTRLEIDTEMPVYAVGITEQEVPFAFGSAFPNLNFNWSVSNQNIVQLRSVFQQNDIQQSNENNFAMRVLAKQAGHVTLRLDVSPVELSSGVFSQIIQNSQLSAEVQIEIYERLELLIPEIDNSKILMSPHSQKKLRSNRDGFTRVTYALLSLRSEPDPDVTVDNSGLLKSGSKTGSIQVVVTSYEDFDVKQCLTVLVEVKLISYLSVGIHTIIKTDSWPLPVIPLGLTMTMEVHFHSDTGRKFNALNTSLKFRPSRDGFTRVTYALLSLRSEPDPDVTVDNSGLLKSGSKTGSIQVVVTSYEDFDVKQCLTVLVEVKLISYLSVGIHTIIKTDSWPLPVIPLGLTMTMEVHFHSDTGRKFNALNTSLKFRPSSISTCKMTNQNNFEVWDAINPHLVDYINMIIGTAIDPIETSLTIGDIVCYSSPLVTQEGQHGSWFSTNNVMVIHPTTGIAVAQRVGTDTVHYNVSNVLVTNIQVNVKPASVIIIDRTAVKHISNVPREKPYIIPILLRSEANQKMSNLLGKNCSQEVINSASFILNQFPFNCELSLVKPSIDISINDIFQTMIGFDWEKGQYYCGILPINKASFHDISMLNAEVILHIQLLEQTGRQTVQTTAMSTAKTINFPFFPAFHVFLEELVLSNIQPVGTVAVSAISSIQECIAVIPSDSNLLEIHQPKTDSNHPYTLMFPVAIRDISSLWQMDVLTASLHLEISCSLTKQMVIIPVKLKLIGLKDGVQCSPVTYNVGWKSAAQILWENYQSFMITVLSIIGTIAALFIGYRSLLNSRSQILTTSQPNVFVRSYGESYSPSTSLPYSPWRSTPSGDSPHMQNASRPHLWSVDNRVPGGHSPPIRTLHTSQ
ncbi:nuclear pore membrane glycoprotein 210-like [Centruroides sculpturatus]|uniref:nuclear pore membrane glycoprotein 210-like n=1 Tax=Centruroides sculpturatus TaxID=218467 RepID=UPI000C6C91EC|nr:nuclear pore membrane glycoprotein 210-like [Centruroides sculpturatus]